MSDDVQFRGPAATGEALVSAMHRLEQQAISRAELAGVSTGFREIDQATRGLNPGELVVIAGRPSTGKTSLATSIALAISVERDPKQQSGVLFYSTDHGRDDYTLRCLSTLSHIDFNRLREGRLADRDW